MLEKLIAAMVFVLPITMGTVAGAANAVFIVLCVTGLWFGWAEWKKLEAGEKALCFGMIAFFLSALLSFINAEDVAKSWTRLERLLRVLAFTPIYLLLRSQRQLLLAPLSYGAIIAGPVVLVSALFTMPNARAEGAYNEILFGDYTACIALFLCGYIALEKTQRRTKIAAIGSLICAFQAMVLSGTRGAWIAVPVGILLILAFASLQNSDRKDRVRMLGSSAAALLALLITAFASESVRSRTAAIFTGFSGYLDGSDPHTSVGQRLQMWQAGIEMWQEHPWVGTGLGDYYSHLGAMIQSGRSQLTEHFGEAHNLYVEFLATTGIIGVGLCIVFLFVQPIRLGLGYARSMNSNLVTPALLVTMIAAFAVFGLTQNWLGRSSITSTYIVLMAVLLTDARKQNLGH